MRWATDAFAAPGGAINEAAKALNDILDDRLLEHGGGKIIDEYAREDDAWGEKFTAGFDDMDVKRSVKQDVDSVKTLASSARTYSTSHHDGQSLQYRHEALCVVWQACIPGYGMRCVRVVTVARGGASG